MKYLGQRVWFIDGAVYSSQRFHWADLPYDGLLVRMLYYEGGGKQIQQGTSYYYEAPHHSGEVIRGAGMDADDIERRYPGAVIKRGQWAPDEYYRKVVDEAMASTWNDGN